MSIDKTQRLTDESGSEITTYLDRNIRISFGESHD